MYCRHLGEWMFPSIERFYESLKFHDLFNLLLQGAVLAAVASHKFTSFYSDPNTKHITDFTEDDPTSSGIYLLAYSILFQTTALPVMPPPENKDCYFRWFSHL